MTNYKLAAVHFATKYTHNSPTLRTFISVTVSGCFLNTTYTLQRVVCQRPDTHKYSE